MPMTDEPLLPIRHVTSRRIIAVRGSALEIRDDRVVGEAPLEIRVGGPQQKPVAVAVTMRTPGFEDELAVGLPPDGGAHRRARGGLDRRRRSGLAEPAGRHHPRPALAAVRRLEGGGAALHRDRVVRHLRQGIDRRGRPPVRPLAGRARRATGGDPRAARSAQDGPEGVRRDRRAARGRPLHAERRADRDPRGRRPAQRARQARRLAGPRGRDAPSRPDPDGVRAGQLRDRPEGGRRRDPDRVRGVRAVRPRDRDRGAPRGDPRRLPPRRGLQRLRATTAASTCGTSAAGAEVPASRQRLAAAAR